MKQVMLGHATVTQDICDKTQPVISNNFTIVTTRFEYANVYWVLVDLYNCFLVMRFLDRRPEETTVLLLDAHPSGLLDPLWHRLFAHVTQLANFPLVTEVNELAWSLPRGHSPLLVQEQSVPLLEDFRIFVLSQLGLPLIHPFSCVFNTTRVIFIWRHDYLSHPRNPQKIISRKISNENELLLLAKREFPSWSIRGFQLDAMAITDQISLVSQCDILVGMHGAALAYSVFLQPGSGMIELFPFGEGNNWHMKYLAKWSRVHYLKWINTNISLENKAEKSTEIPPGVVVNLLSNLHLKMCS